MSVDQKENVDRFKSWKKPIFNKNGWALKACGCIPSDNEADKYGWVCQYNWNLKLGDKVDVGCFTYMNAKYGIEIGDNVQIGSHCSLYSINTENNTKGRIIIGDDCLIGSFTLILPNNTIPPNTKIKAYSIIK